MSQSDFGTINPTTKSGTTLASDLNSWRDAVHTTHKGASRPSYVQAGMLWIDSTTDPWLVKLYDGSQDITILKANASTHAFQLPSQAANTALVNATGSSASPAELSFSASTIFARLAAGNIVAATVAQIKTLLAIANTDVSGLGTASTKNTGTSGNTVPLLDGANAWSKTQSGTPTSLSSSSNSIAVDMSLANNFSHTLTENTTLANPSNTTAGQSGAIYFTQHASSAKTLAFGSNWKQVDGLTQAAPTTTSAKFVVSYTVQDSGQIWYNLSKNGVS